MWFGKNELRLYLNRAKSFRLGGGGPRGPSKYAHDYLYQPFWFKLQAVLFLRNNVYSSLILSFSHQLYTANTQINETKTLGLSVRVYCAAVRKSHM